MAKDNLFLEDLIALIEDYHDFNPADVSFSALPSEQEFGKQVSRGLPCVYVASDLLSSYDASSWDSQTLCSLVQEKIEVAMTPNGRADSLCELPGSSSNEQVFLQPANVDMTMVDLFERLGKSHEDKAPVCYLQSQNSNLTDTPLRQLLSQLPPNFDFAENVLGTPEAINIWIGDEKSVTSVHRDPYENLYLVLRGSKTFTLWPPVDEVCMDARMVRTGRHGYDSDTGTFSIVLDENEDADSDGSSSPKIPWVPIDPHLPREQLNRDHYLYRYAQPRTVTVAAGQILFLPSGWYHHVAQECGRWNDGSLAPCIAVNYWYDMDYEGERYVMRQLVSRLVQKVQAN